MKYCEKCKKKYETEKSACPNCGAELIEVGKDEIDEYETAETVSTMTITGIL